MKTNTGILSDENLIEFIRGGDDGAMDELLKRYKDLVKIKTRSYFLVGGDNDDLLQEGMIGLYKAIRDYDQSKDVLFKPFAYICIDSQILTAIKKANRFKHLPLNDYVSLPFIGDEAESPQLNIFNPEDVIIDKESMALTYQKIESVLSKFEIKVLREFLKGKSYSEIAECLLIKSKSVDNALQRIKAKLKQIF